MEIKMSFTQVLIIILFINSVVKIKSIKLQHQLRLHIPLITSKSAAKTELELS